MCFCPLLFSLYNNDFVKGFSFKMFNLETKSFTQTGLVPYIVTLNEVIPQVYYTIMVYYDRKTVNTI